MGDTVLMSFTILGVGGVRGDNVLKRDVVGVLLLKWSNKSGI
jgi:hypothetical protein